MLTSPIYAALLDADATTPISSSTTESLFRLLDHDVLVAIVRQLLWQPLHPANFRAGHIAAADLAALLQTCRFWRDAVYANGQSERLEAAALASSCIPSAINGGEHRYFYQLLCQVRSAIHVTLLATAIQLMVTPRAKQNRERQELRGRHSGERDLLRVSGLMIILIVLVLIFKSTSRPRRGESTCSNNPPQTFGGA